jgi:hypothetical protein
MTTRRDSYARVREKQTVAVKFNRRKAQRKVEEVFPPDEYGPEHFRTCEDIRRAFAIAIEDGEPDDLDELLRG